MRRLARSLWALASPGGSVSYYARSQEESWTLAMTAYGAESAAALPGTSATDSARFDALAERALERLRALYGGGPFGFWITPALSRNTVRAAVPGLDHYADAASYSGLTLVGLNWALEQMPPDGPAAGQLAADSPGSHRISSGFSAVEVVRTPGLWFAVKQGPGVYVRGVGDYSVDVRYDSGLVALESIAADGSATDVVPLRPHSRAPTDRAEPLLLRGGATGRFLGSNLRSLAGGAVTLTGGFRAGKRWLRRGVTLRYEPAGCGLRTTLPTRRGDRIEQSLWFRGRPHRAGDGLSDARQRVVLSQRPSALSLQPGYASGAEAHLVRVRLRFRGTGRPLAMTFCPAGSGP